ncbi:MAG: helix-hairpin-helix domain-containing protein [Neisseriaceae bacterium]|nr:MAG: helix-hairpin-helix domain-containing protein [Neisseriaceae bacterium]
MWHKIFAYCVFYLFSFNCVLATINLNSATKKELEMLVGIGAVKAKAIINYRREHGQFTSVEEIMKVPGIGKKIYLQNINQLSVTIPTDTDEYKKKQNKQKKIKNKQKKIKSIYPVT